MIIIIGYNLDFHLILILNQKLLNNHSMRIHSFYFDEIMLYLILIIMKHLINIIWGIIRNQLLKNLLYLYHISILYFFILIYYKNFF